MKKSDVFLTAIIVALAIIAFPDCKTWISALCCAAFAWGVPRFCFSTTCNAPLLKLPRPRKERWPSERSHCSN